MKLFRIISLAFIAGMLPLIAAAKPGPGGPDQPGGPGDGLARADLNEDGRITADEFEEAGRRHREKMFQRIDKDGDGALTEKEIRAHRKHAMAERKQRMAERRERMQERRSEYRDDDRE